MAGFTFEVPRPITARSAGAFCRVAKKKITYIDDGARAFKRSLVVLTDGRAEMRDIRGDGLHMGPWRGPTQNWRMTQRGFVRPDCGWKAYFSCLEGGRVVFGII